MTALYLIVLVFVLTAAYGAASAAPWLPTKPRERRNLVAQLPMRGDETVYDLGCGDGTLLFALAAAHPGITAVGYDVALLPLCIGWARKLLSPRRYRKVHLRFGDLFRANIADADLVIIFLMSKAYPKLMEKFRRELPPHARIAVEAWPLPGVPASKTIEGDGLLPVYIYEGKACKS
ncbi:hypothetical protein HYS28_03235 [Candidatus Uhrbacteria bacterium]|nr:hypothetical protein [Candidatus Uhrbacteria bacterium]